MTTNPTVRDVTERIRERSRSLRSAYLQRLAETRNRDRGSDRMGCANVAHAVAGIPANDKFRVVSERAPNIGVVTAYNDMLSAHAPYQGYPDIVSTRRAALAPLHRWPAASRPGATAHAGHARNGAEPSAATIAMSTAVALTHDMFDAALLLGVCDKIVPGLLIGARISVICRPSVPAGRWLRACRTAPSPRSRRPRVSWAGKACSMSKCRPSRSGHRTFYGTANSNQMLLEASLHAGHGLHPAWRFDVALTRGGAHRLGRAGEASFAVPPIGEMVDETRVVNAGRAAGDGRPTNHLIHWVVARRGHPDRLERFFELSEVVPLLTRVYPNGSAGQRIPGRGRTAASVNCSTPADACRRLRVRAAFACSRTSRPWTGAPSDEIRTPVARRRAVEERCRRATGVDAQRHRGQLLNGNLGRSVIKVSSVPDDRHVIEAPARVFESQAALQQAFNAGELERDVVCVVRWQGPQANGMPEPHKRRHRCRCCRQGFRVALVTDGRMSGARERFRRDPRLSRSCREGRAGCARRRPDPSRFHRRHTHRAAAGRRMGRRETATLPEELCTANGHGLGRPVCRHAPQCIDAEEGACTWP
jgi:phosphogluconate dehydratase